MTRPTDEQLRDLLLDRNVPWAVYLNLSLNRKRRRSIQVSDLVAFVAERLPGISEPERRLDEYVQAIGGQRIASWSLNPVRRLLGRQLKPENDFYAKQAVADRCRHQHRRGRRPPPPTIPAVRDRARAAKVALAATAAMALALVAMTLFNVPWLAFVVIALLLVILVARPVAILGTRRSLALLSITAAVVLIAFLLQRLVG